MTAEPANETPRHVKRLFEIMMAVLPELAPQWAPTPLDEHRPNHCSNPTQHSSVCPWESSNARRKRAIAFLSARWGIAPSSFMSYHAMHRRFDMDRTQFFADLKRYGGLRRERSKWVGYNTGPDYPQYRRDTPSGFRKRTG